MIVQKQFEKFNIRLDLITVLIQSWLRKEMFFRKIEINEEMPRLKNLIKAACYESWC